HDARIEIERERLPFIVSARVEKVVGLTGLNGPDGVLLGDFPEPVAREIDLQRVDDARRARKRAVAIEVDIKLDDEFFWFRRADDGAGVPAARHRRAHLVDLARRKTVAG